MVSIDPNPASTNVVAASRGALHGARRLRDIAEDAAAEAFAVAAERWPRDGEPANPAGRLVTTARNRAVDQLRRRRRLAGKTALLARDLETGPPPPEDAMDDRAAIPDERLELIFTCCHPSLALDAPTCTFGSPATGGRSPPCTARSPSGPAPRSSR
ncbi:hypothetical protein [Actinomadura chokoriensis]|uniref:hypothetical protein n=1 Tax=Actinomadura chokoriensis TaxID=454156 RepID=UPI0031F973AB